MPLIVRVYPSAKYVHNLSIGYLGIWTWEDISDEQPLGAGGAPIVSTLSISTQVHI